MRCPVEVGETKGKYHAIVESAVTQNIAKVVPEGEEPISLAQMIKIIKSTKGLQCTENEGSIKKAIGRVPAWKNRKKLLQEAWKEKGTGKTYMKRKGEKDPFQDV